MPGEISRAYDPDPEFNDGADTTVVLDALREVQALLTNTLATDRRKYIGDVARGPGGPAHECRITARELRLLRFAVDRVIEELA